MVSSPNDNPPLPGACPTPVPANARTIPRARLCPPAIPSLRRERLQRLLDSLSQRRLAVVVAPPGSGKTTLLDQIATDADGPVAWYRAESDDSSSEALLHSLSSSFSAALGRERGHFDCVEELVEWLEESGPEGSVLVVDDLHTLERTAAEATLARFIDYAPRTVKVVAASRCPPGFDVSRSRVSGDLLEIGPDELRFRSWEIEKLFRDFYRQPLHPEDLAELARCTEGWVAGLHLFHLATRGMPRSERRRVLATASSRSRGRREYLARNLVDGLPATLRAFLLGTCVLGQLTGALCDELLESSGSEQILKDLERQQIFTYAIDGGRAYRYHEVLRSHLQVALLEERGEVATRHLFRRSGELLERAGALSHALLAYCRAEDWESTARLLGREGPQLADNPGAWLHMIPASLVQHDQWLLLAAARRSLASGRLQEALETYGRAEQAFGQESAGSACARERLVLAAWLGNHPPVARDWLGMLRAAMRKEPLAIAQRAAESPGAPARFVEGAARLLAGQAAEGRRLLSMAAEARDLSPVLALAARLAAAATSFTCGPHAAGDFELLAEESEGLDMPILTRLCRAALAIEGAGGRIEAAAAHARCGCDGDPWGCAIVAFFRGLGALAAGEPARELFEESAQGFHALGAQVAEAWAMAASAAAQAAERNPGAADALRRARACARSAGAHGADVVVFGALTRLSAEPASEPTLARAGDSTEGTRPPATANRAPSMVLRCFGGFALELAGRTLDWRELKPRARAVLHLLAVAGGQPVHRESLLAALWPGMDEATGLRNLQVAISSLRHWMEPGVARGASSLILREGDTYRLGVPDDGFVDLLVFERELDGAAQARVRGDGVAAEAALERVLDVYTGDLLPEDGPAEWAVPTRDRYRMEAADAAQALAELQLLRGDVDGAVRTSERGLHIDRYRDALWRSLIRAHSSAGNQVAAARARLSYEGVMVELGLSPSQVTMGADLLTDELREGSK